MKVIYTHTVIEKPSRRGKRSIAEARTVAISGPHNPAEVDVVATIDIDPAIVSLVTEGGVITVLHAVAEADGGVVRKYDITVDRASLNSLTGAERVNFLHALLVADVNAQLAAARTAGRCISMETVEEETRRLQITDITEVKEEKPLKMPKIPLGSVRRPFVTSMLALRIAEEHDFAVLRQPHTARAQLNFAAAVSLFAAASPVHLEGAREMDQILSEIPETASEKAEEEEEEEQETSDVPMAEQEEEPSLAVEEKEPAEPALVSLPSTTARARRADGLPVHPSVVVALRVVAGQHEIDSLIVHKGQILNILPRPRGAFAIMITDSNVTAPPVNPAALPVLELDLNPTYREIEERGTAGVDIIQETRHPQDQYAEVQMENLFSKIGSLATDTLARLRREGPVDNKFDLVVLLRFGDDETLAFVRSLLQRKLRADVALIRRHVILDTVVFVALRPAHGARPATRSFDVGWTQTNVRFVELDE